MLFNKHISIFTFKSPPQGHLGFGVAFFVSVFVHGLFFVALSTAFKPKPVELLGSLMGSPRKGLEVYIAQASSLGQADTADKASAINNGLEANIISSKGQDAALQNEEVKPASTIQGINFTNSNGFIQPLPSTDQISGRQSGFLGPSTPAGTPEGAIPLSVEWAMRRQSALRTIGMQMDFMRQAFVIEEGATCVVGLNQASCNPPNPGLMGFLSSRYNEMRHLDPSLPAMQWRSHGYGQWSFEFQEQAMRPQTSAY